MTGEIVLFFDEKPQALAVYEALEAWLLAVMPRMEIRVRKTQISFFDGCMFACVSLPRRKCDPGLLLTLSLPARENSPRICQAVEAYPGRWTHHVPVQSPAQIDEELKNWLIAAWQFARIKKRI